MKKSIGKFTVLAVCTTLILSSASCSVAPSSEPKAGTSPQSAEILETRPEDIVTKERKARIKELADDYISEQDFSGTVLVGVDDAVLYTSVSGLANKETGDQNQIHTKYEIGSVTKQFTATAIMLLYEQGKLAVTDTVEKYFPEYLYADRVTVENLLNMTSGIPDYLNDVLYLFEQGELSAEDTFTAEELLTILNNRALDFEPGTQYAYSNSNYYLLGDIIEQVSGMPYSQFIRQNILEPLKMQNTSFDLKNATAKGYYKDGEEALRADTSYFGAAGEMVSTVQDLFQWQDAFINGKIVSKATVHKMLTDNGFGYGYGWFLDEDKCYHEGNTMAFYSIDMISYLEGIRVVVLSNVDDKLAAEIGMQMYTIAKSSLFA